MEGSSSRQVVLSQVEISWSAESTSNEQYDHLAKQGESTMTESAAPVRVIEETPGYWRVVFDYPPFNIMDASMFDALQDLLKRMDTSSNLRVAVFESANPKFYLAHFDLTGKLGNIMTAIGPP
jgi:hypothetical protein